MIWSQGVAYTGAHVYGMTPRGVYRWMIDMSWHAPLLNYVDLVFSTSRELVTFGHYINVPMDWPKHVVWMCDIYKIFGFLYFLYIELCLSVVTILLDIFRYMRDSISK